MKLYVDFPDSFGSLPNDIQQQLYDWQQVKYLYYYK